MLIGPMGTAFLPKAVFGLFERFSTFSAVVFNGVLGIYLMMGRFSMKNRGVGILLQSLIWQIRKR